MFALIRDGQIVATIPTAEFAAEIGGGLAVELSPEFQAAARGGWVLAWDSGTETLTAITPEPVRDAQGIWALFTADEKMAICLSEIPEVRALVAALPFTPATSPSSPWHAPAVQLLAFFQFLTPARALQVLAFEAPPA